MIKKFKNGKIKEPAALSSKSLSLFLSLYFLMVPAVSFAAGPTLKDLLTGFGGLVTKSIPIVFALALLYFFYGVAKFILAAGNTNDKVEGKSIMVYGVIALFVMVSVWGLVKFIGDNLDIQPKTFKINNQ